MKAYNYTQAQKEVELAQRITIEQAKAYILDTSNNAELGTIKFNDNERDLFNKHFPALTGTFRARVYLGLAIDIKNEVIKSGAYPYLDTIAIRLLDNLGIISINKVYISRASDICYQTGKYSDELALLNKYNHMYGLGYIHTDEIIEDMHDKKALLKGTASNDFLGITKDNEEVKLVCKGTARGYRKPRMRTRYHPFTIGSDLFIKLI